jgi:hypothetical protein
VNQVNQATPRCKHPVPYDLSEENQKLRFFELISLPDMFCGLGEKLYYDYERQ